MTKKAKQWKPSAPYTYIIKTTAGTFKETGFRCADAIHRVICKEFPQYYGFLTECEYNLILKNCLISYEEIKN